MSAQRILMAGVVAVSLLACGSSGIIGPNDLTRLGHAKARWDSRGFADYQYEIRTFCFCPPEMGQWTRVTVRSGTVVSADAVEPDPSYPITTIQWWQPIDSLFSNLHRAMTEGTFTSAYARIVVDYDADLGYPRSIEYVERPNVADAGATISVRSVVPLN